MLVMILVLFSTYFLAMIYRLFQNKQKKIASIYFIFWVIVIIVLVAGLRTNIGDTYVYIEGYRKYEGQTFSEAMEGKGDVGFFAFTYALYQISSNPQFMIFIIAFLTQIFYMKFFMMYKTYMELEVYIYIASGYYFVTMNGMRQSLAAVLVILSTKYIISSDFKKFLIIILMASVIHQSAIIMVPIYFISRIKTWSGKLFLMIGIALIATAMFYELLPILERVLQGTNYEHYIEVFMEGSEEGANALRLGVAIVPVFLAYINKNNMEDSLFNRVFINISVINAIFMLFSLQTWIFARFTLYFNLYNCILLPYLICKWPNKKEKKFLYGFLIICYFVFFMKEQSVAERIRFYKF